MQEKQVAGHRKQRKKEQVRKGAGVKVSRGAGDGKKKKRKQETEDWMQNIKGVGRKIHLAVKVTQGFIKARRV